MFRPFLGPPKVRTRRSEVRLLARIRLGLSCLSGTESTGIPVIASKGPTARDPQTPARQTGRGRRLRAWPVPADQHESDRVAVYRCHVRSVHWTWRRAPGMHPAMRDRKEPRSVRSCWALMQILRPEGSDG